MVSPLFTLTTAGSNGGMRIGGGESNGSSSLTLKVTVSCETFSGGAFFIYFTSKDRFEHDCSGRVKQRGVEDGNYGPAGVAWIIRGYDSRSLRQCARRCRCRVRGTPVRVVRIPPWRRGRLRRPGRGIRPPRFRLAAVAGTGSRQPAMVPAGGGNWMCADCGGDVCPRFPPDPGCMPRGRRQRAVPPRRRKCRASVEARIRGARGHLRRAGRRRTVPGDFTGRERILRTLDGCALAGHVLGVAAGARGARAAASGQAATSLGAWKTDSAVAVDLGRDAVAARPGV